MMKLRSLVLESYDMIHDYRDFDDSCLVGSMVSDLFVELFKKGPQYLFSCLKECQPLTYDALINCEGLWLLESKTAERKEGSIFTLAIVFEDYFITSQMIHKGMIERRERYKRNIPNTLKYLNSKFHGYYYVFNGLSNPGTRSAIGLENYDLPAPVGQWDEIGEYCDEYSIDKKVFSKVSTAVSNDLLVWIVNDKGDYYLIEESEHNQSVYHVNLNNNGSYIELSDPVEEIDNYCSQVIRGDFK